MKKRSAVPQLSQTLKLTRHTFHLNLCHVWTVVVFSLCAGVAPDVHHHVINETSWSNLFKSSGSTFTSYIFSVFPGETGVRRQLSLEQSVWWNLISFSNPRIIPSSPAEQLHIVYHSWNASFYLVNLSYFSLVWLEMDDLNVWNRWLSSVLGKYRWQVLFFLILNHKQPVWPQGTWPPGLPGGGKEHIRTWKPEVS